MARNLYVDLTSRTFMAGPGGGNPQIAPFFAGDTETLNLYFFQQTGIVSKPYEIVDKSSASVKVGIGTLASEPTGGTWTITYGGQTTSNLAASSSVAEIQTALNALSSVSSAGGVTVTGSLVTNFQITFNSAGTRTAFTVDVSNLFPTTEAVIQRRVTGTSSVNDVQQILLFCDPAVSQTSFSSAATGVTATVSMVATGATGVNCVQKLSFTQVPNAGTFTLSLPGVTIGAVTAPVVGGLFTTTSNHGLSVNQPVLLQGFTGLSGATAGTTYSVFSVPSQTSFYLRLPASFVAMDYITSTTSTSPYVQTITESAPPFDFQVTPDVVEKSLQKTYAIGAGNIRVTGIPGEYYYLNFSNQKGLSSMPLFTVVSTLSSPAGKTGTLAVTGAAINDLLSDEVSASAMLEIELTESGNKLTAAQAPVTVNQQLIP